MIQYFSLWFSRENSNSHNVSALKPIQIEPYLSSFWLTMKLVVASASSMSSWFFWIEDIAISFVKLAIFKRRFLDVEKLRTSCRYVRIVTDSQLHTTQAVNSKFDYDFFSSNYNANQLLEISNFWLFTKATIFVGSYVQQDDWLKPACNVCAQTCFFMVLTLMRQSVFKKFRFTQPFQQFWNPNENSQLVWTLLSSLTTASVSKLGGWHFVCSHCIWGRWLLAI